MKINEILGEQDPTLGTKKFKSYLKQELAKLNLEPTGRQSAQSIRFPLKGTTAEFRAFFGKMNVDIQDTIKSISGSFVTYELTMNVPVDGEESEQWSILWVNNVVGTEESGRQFGVKQLTPDDLGVTGKAITKEALLNQTNAILKTQYSEHAQLLSAILSRAAASDSGSISLSGLDMSKYQVKDLAVISKNFGEIIAGAWAFDNMKFDNVTFPTAINLKLIDFFGNDEYPVSVKSGGGGKVTIQNILDALQDKIKSGKIDVEEQKSYNVFKIVNSNSMKNGFFQLHKYFKTKPMQQLAAMIGIGLADITLDDVIDWLDTKSIDELKTELVPYLATMNGKITDAIWDRGDKLRFIISPMGRWMVKYLNDATEIRESMSNLAAMLSVIQVNVDVSHSTINIKQKPFGDAEFVFAWADYNAGNKLGFLMKT